jgi:hypothetical protein
VKYVRTKDAITGSLATIAVIAVVIGGAVFAPYFLGKLICYLRIIDQGFMCQELMHGPGKWLLGLSVLGPTVLAVLWAASIQEAYAADRRDVIKTREYEHERGQVSVARAQDGDVSFADDRGGSDD